MTKFDAHAHSNRSDGTDDPAAVIVQAKKAGLDAVALTDHDTFSGLEEAAAAAAQVGIELVPGAELSTRVRGRSLHLLVYYPDVTNPELLELLLRIRESRTERIKEMAARMSADFPGISWEALQQSATDGKPWGRPHLADALVQNGYINDRGEAFQRILHPTSPYYVLQWSPSPEEMVEAARRSGGVPVIAHPLSGWRGQVDRSTLTKMVDAGLFGLERDHREHDGKARAMIDELAAEFGLQVTGGSDFHGTGKPNRLAENLTSPLVLDLIKEQAGL